MNTVEPIKTRAQVEQMKSVLKARSERDYTLFVLAVNTGFRVGDLLALKVGDVLAGKGTRLLISQDLTVREQKTRKPRRVVLNRAARLALRRYIAGRGGRLALSEPLFISRKRGKNGEKRAITRVQAWRQLARAARACGIEKFGTHSMRKTFGYFHYKSGQPLEEIQKIFNHTSPAITLYYIGITQEILDKSYKDVEI